MAETQHTQRELTLKERRRLGLLPYDGRVPRKSKEERELPLFATLQEGQADAGR
jgi:hypothetical protein